MGTNLAYLTRQDALTLCLILFGFIVSKFSEILSMLTKLHNRRFLIQRQLIAEQQNLQVMNNCVEQSSSIVLDYQSFLSFLFTLHLLFNKSLLIITPISLDYKLCVN